MLWNNNVWKYTRDPIMKHCREVEYLMRMTLVAILRHRTT